MLKAVGGRKRVVEEPGEEGEGCAPFCQAAC